MLMTEDQPGRHNHISGRTRRYISRKWFHRARHKPTKSRESVAELVEAIGAEVRCTQPWRTKGWHIVDGGKYMCMHGAISIPDHFEPQADVVMLIRPDEGVATIDALVDENGEVQWAYGNPPTG